MSRVGLSICRDLMILLSHAVEVTPLICTYSNSMGFVLSLYFCCAIWNSAFVSFPFEKKKKKIHELIKYSVSTVNPISSKRTLSKMREWMFDLLRFFTVGQAESALEKLKTEYVCGWLSEVMKTHYEVFISCLLPHPADYVRVGGHWCEQRQTDGGYLWKIYAFRANIDENNWSVKYFNKNSIL